MSKIRQAESFRRQVKTRLLTRRESITSFASRMGYARNTVSIAINHYRFPGVLAAIRKELKLSELNEN